MNGQVHERQSSDERDVRDQLSDDDEFDDDGDQRQRDRCAPHRVPDFRSHPAHAHNSHHAHAHCSRAAEPTVGYAHGNVLHGSYGSAPGVDADTTFSPFRRAQPEPEVELTDCSSCSSVDTAPPERHAVPTRQLDTVARVDDDDDDDDEIINVVDDLVT